MPVLIANLSTGKGTWAEVNRMISSFAWSRVFLITNQFGKDNFTCSANTELILVNAELDSRAQCDVIIKELRGKITDFEVAINFASGSGREHMALLEAIMEMGFSFRIVTLTNGNYDVLGIRRE